MTKSAPVPAVDEFGEPVVCLDAEFSPQPCRGPVGPQLSRSGLTRSYRCAAHQRAHDERMDELEAGLDQRYPGWRSSAAYVTPPAGWSPLDAGERWNEDDPWP